MLQTHIYKTLFIKKGKRFIKNVLFGWFHFNYVKVNVNFINLRDERSKILGPEQIFSTQKQKLPFELIKLTENPPLWALVEKSGELSNYFERDLLAVIAYTVPAGL